MMSIEIFDRGNEMQEKIIGVKIQIALSLTGAKTHNKQLVEDDDTGT